jgi:pimeloyl-ACP methyl ester carboxylesterase
MTTPFRIDIPQSTIDGILGKVAAYDWHEMPEIDPGADRWAYGTDMVYLKELCAYWLNGYSWRATEEKLNRFPQFKTNVDGLDVHYIHVKGSGKAPKTVLMTHGWPGSVFEFMDVIEPLTQPEKFGGNAEDGVTLIVPSLPGYGFSGKPAKPIGPRHTARLWSKLMQGLGIKRYIAQGGDWGSIVSSYLAYNHSVAKGGGCTALHLNMFSLTSSEPASTDEEKAWQAAVGPLMMQESAYMQLQMTKPQTLSYGMMDSPVGACAWILEKFNTWSDTRGADGGKNIENAYSKDQLLSNIMIYLVTRSFNTATWMYRGAAEEGLADLQSNNRISVPTGFAEFPKEFILPPPRSFAERTYDIIRWTKMSHGGHFAAMETGKDFADELREFVKMVDA